MFNVINVSKAYGPKKLFEEVNVSFSPGRRYGLTGPNGAGKSTFMKILAGDEEADMGTLSRPKRLGILRQDHFRYEDRSEEHTSELQSRQYLVCRLLLEKKK